MASKKRNLEDAASSKAKKSKLTAEGSALAGKKANKEKEKAAKPPPLHVLNAAPEEIDFPRGGGTSFTAQEVKAIRDEAMNEANQLFGEHAQKPKNARKMSGSKGKGTAVEGGGKKTSGGVRIEHLNYKRITVGMKILAQVVSIESLALVVSLPNQLYGHVPITQISSELTSALESMDVDDEPPSEEEEEEDADTKASHPPDLFDLFRPGQYLRCIVAASHAAGTTKVGERTGRTRDEVEKASRRVELSLIPEQVNQGVLKTDLKPGFTMSASVKSVEDHGYILNLGVAEVSGFLSFKDAKKLLESSSQLPVGSIVDASISKLLSNGRTCNVTIAPSSIRASYLKEVTNVTSILPGELVQCLITDISPLGLNVQVLGYFDGTIDEYHLPPGNQADNFKAGKKVKARVLYEIPGSSPPRFALSLASHITLLEQKSIGAGDDEGDTSIEEAYPVGTTLDAVKVVRVEAGRGLLVDVQEAVQGFVHISHTSDEYVPSLSASSGAWKIGASHRARVIGYHPFDGILQLSMRASVLEQKFLRVSDVQVGELLKGTVKKLIDNALFVSISGSVDGVVFPSHYADIMLKHPQKRFKEGANIKCRVLVVDPERKRVALTAKKTLVESDLPLISRVEDAQVGMVTHAVIFKITEKRLLVEFFNSVKGSIPLKEAGENLVGPLSSSFAVGKPVKVRIISVNPEKRNITASIRRTAPSFDIKTADISAVEIGSNVEGIVTEIHKDNALLSLKQSNIRALLSLKNLANHRNLSIPQLRTSLKVGEELNDLVVVTRNPEKGIVIVASRPKTKPTLDRKRVLKIDTVEIGQLVGGRVLRHFHSGTVLKFSGKITGTLHPTDASDDYETGVPFPVLDSIVKAAVISFDKDKKQLVVSARVSRTTPDDHPPIVDREICGIEELKVGETVRGFVKSIPEHGLFVTLGRSIDARVQIKELFDEFVKEWRPRFQMNQLVKGRILSIDAINKKVELTFRSGTLSRATGPTLSDFQEGQKVKGRVKKIEDYGIFVEIEGSKVSGLCHKSELSDNKDADAALALRSFQEGDIVKAFVTSVDLDKRRISFSLRPSHFVDEDFQQTDDTSSKEDEGSLGVVKDVEMASVEEDGVDDAESDADSEDEGSEAESMVVDIGADIQILDPKQGDVTIVPSSARPAPVLKIQGGFQWSGDIPQENADEPESSEDSDADEQGTKKKRKRKKKVELDLTADMHTKRPESTSDFERVLLGSPNSSYLWIQYMSFQLQLSEIEKAREVAKRALDTISFREEREKLNVWIALMNLENVYGSEESLESAFRDAARHCEPKTVHLRLASILEESGKLEKAEEQYKRTCKKFGQSAKVWTLFGEHYLKRGDVEQARKLLPRSLQSLEKRKHLKVVSKFAQLEYKLGEPERGKTLFEGVVDSHPKRWDLWSIYIDMEAGQNDMQSIRNLFDRVLALKMTSHKAKAFFKRWLALEKRVGDDAGAETVKAKAIEWTRRAATNTTGDEV
ncbi:nucleic acid-binding protein [Russula earlei]|uniref:Nucleic acid-binding protein n=1 Tax=Russula earlei TaxID=71964 RepID=A0ACC0U560_9AGAM|nr:nucleic acid-binding protein [Russula earlei]